MPASRSEPTIRGDRRARRSPWRPLYVDEVADWRARDAGQRSARARRSELPAGRRFVPRPCRRADHLLDQPGPRRGDRRGTLPRDLFHRLSVVPIGCRRSPSGARTFRNSSRIPRNRRADVGVTPRKVGADAMAVLQSHDWPGNIRQLRNNVERLMILAVGDPNAEISGLDAARRSGRARSGDSERHRRREALEPAPARRARGVRARLFDRAAQPLRRQHLPPRRIHWDRAFGSAPEAKVARSRVEADRGIPLFRLLGAPPASTIRSCSL